MGGRRSDACAGGNSVPSASWLWEDVLQARREGDTQADPSLAVDPMHQQLLIAVAHDNPVRWADLLQIYANGASRASRPPRARHGALRSVRMRPNHETWRIDDGSAAYTS